MPDEPQSPKPQSRPAPPSTGEVRSAGAEQTRLASLDACRGLVMILLASSGFGLRRAAELHLAQQPDSSVWEAVRYQASHTEWVGCSVWDMIQPLFMFMVGVAMAYSYAKRQSLGHSYRRMFGHAASRAATLILLGFVLISVSRGMVYWSLMNVLSQIGLGYLFVFLLWNRRFLVQLAVALVILVGTWTLYESYVWTGSNSPPDATQPAEVGPAWRINDNIGYAIDQRLLGWLPTGEQAGWKFGLQMDKYVTINFIPSIATMLFGLMCGGLLRCDRSSRSKLLLLVGYGLAGIAAGAVLHATGVCPLVKKIWTPAFALFSGGICLLVLAALLAMIDVARFRWWAFPLILVGMNPLAVYCAEILGLGQGINRVFRIFLTDAPYGLLGPLNQPIMWGIMTALGFVLICWWMYRQKIFIRI